MEVSDLNQVSPLSFGWYSGQQRLGSLWCWRNISGAVGSPFDVSTAPFSLSFFACPCFCSVPFIYVCHSYSFIILSYSFLFLSLFALPVLVASKVLLCLLDYTQD